MVGDLRTGRASLVSNRGGAAGPCHVDAATPAAVCGVSNGPLLPDQAWPKVAPVVWPSVLRTQLLTPYCDSTCGISDLKVLNSVRFTDTQKEH